jgi:hypothetical protein
MKNPYELKDLLSRLDGGYSTDFITTKGIQTGIIRLHPTEKDTHVEEKVY